MVANRGAGFDIEAGPELTRHRIGLVGCGRIGRLHAELLVREVPGFELVAVADIMPSAAQGVAEATGARVRSIDAVISAPDIDAVAICTSTDTHVEMIRNAAKAGKAIFAEKPVSLDLEQVDRAVETVDAEDVPFMIGFNRRFDPGCRSVREAVVGGVVGEVHLVRMTGRDPAPPPPEYVATSGGIFLDMMIHDFDMARFVTGSEVVEVFARGAVRIDPRIGDAGDVDTAVAILTHADGTLTTIDNSRQAVYGYDQRLEVFGSSGMAISDNQRQHGYWQQTRDSMLAMPLEWSFLARYRESYGNEWRAFHAFLTEGGPSPIGIHDARATTAVALAAARSLSLGRPVRMDEIG